MIAPAGQRAALIRGPGGARAPFTPGPRLEASPRPGNVQILAQIAHRLKSDCGLTGLPSLFFFTDPARTPDPAAIAAALPRGTVVVYRHFSRPDRLEIARTLAAIARRRGLMLLIGADPALAHAAGAHGVHLPERLAGRAKALKTRNPRWLVTAAAHSARALARTQGADLAVLSTLFPSRSPSAQSALGPLRAARLAAHSPVPVIALGGITAKTARKLTGRGFAGLAAIDGFLET